MRLLTATTRITFGLVGLSLSVCLLANTFGILPDPAAELMAARTRFSEAVAIHCALLVANDDQKRLEVLLDAVQQRNSKVRSVVVRRADGMIYAAAGNHSSTDSPGRASGPAAGVMQVPIIRGDRDWGRVELQFHPMFAPGFVGWLHRPLVRLAIFIASASYLLYFFYLRKVLEHLDPSQVIPERVRTTLDTLAEGLIVVDRDDRIMLANSSFAKTLSTTPSSLIGRRASSLPWEVADGCAPAESYPWVQSLKDGERQLGRMLILKGTNGKRSIFKINASPIVVGSDKPRGAFVSFDDVTLVEENRAEMRGMLDTLRRSRDEIRRQNRELEMLATRDPLTSCLNRRAFFHSVEAYWTGADQSRRELSCLMVDVDHFKQINDNHGHRVGDLVLQKVGEILRTGRPDGDLVCRYGGEEFCIFLADASIADAAAVGEVIRLAIESASFDNVKITASIGVSSRNLGARDAQGMIDEADQCLYVAKRNGRNQVVRWDKVDEYPGVNKTVPTDAGDEADADRPPLVEPLDVSIPIRQFDPDLVDRLVDVTGELMDLCQSTQHPTSAPANPTSVPANRGG